MRKRKFIIDTVSGLLAILLVASVLTNAAVLDAPLGWYGQPNLTDQKSERGVSSLGAQSLITNVPHDGTSPSASVQPIAITSPGSYTVTLSSGKYEITDEGEYSAITMDGFGYLLIPGEPKLPSKIFLIAIPPDAEISSVELVGESHELIPENCRIIPAPPREVFGAAPYSESENNYKAIENATVYASSTNYPENVWEYLGISQMRKYRFAEIRFSPIAYNPVEGNLVLYKTITVEVNYDLPVPLSVESLAVMVMEDAASEILYNYNEAQRWYGYAPQSSTYDYVIITHDSLVSTINPLKSWKEQQGYKVNVVNISWIASNYPGTETADKIRNFLADKYTQWGIKYVLLVGSSSIIPMKYCYPDPSNHCFNPDPYFDEGEVPTDYYYADLTGNWDSDGDGYYGEFGQDNYDLYPEVYVGRIPFDDPSVVEGICTKSMNYEQDAGVWKKKVLLLSAILNYQLEDYKFYPKCDGATLNELLWNNVLDPKGYSCVRMYEKEGLRPSSYDCDENLTIDNVVNAWQEGYGIVNLIGHGNPHAAYRWIWAADNNGNNIPESDPAYNEMLATPFINLTPQLDNTYPSIIFAQSCQTAYPELSNLGQSLLQKGAVAYIGSTRVSSYAPFWDEPNDGAMQSIDYYFFYYLLNQSQHVGDALYNSNMYYAMNMYSTWDDLWNVLGVNLYGDPSLSTAGGATTVNITPPAQYVSPGPFTIDVTVDPAAQIAGVQFDLSFNPALISANSVTEGNLLNQGGATTYFIPGTINNAAGTITGVAGAITSPGQTVSPPGIFATIHLTAKSVDGTSALDLSNVIVGNINGNPVSITVNDGSVTVGESNYFDTGTGAYPSISGTHSGTIEPSSNIMVTTFYTYAFPGTGGHSKSIELYENGALVTSGIWDGYGSDWRNITLTPAVTLQAGHTYNYTIVTDSYPQIIHAESKDVTGGRITCTEFVDINGKLHEGWIPAIRLE